MRPTPKNPKWLALTKAKRLCFKKWVFALKIIVVPFKPSLISTYLPWINSVTHSRSAARILHAPTSPLVHGRHTRYLLFPQPQGCSWHLCGWRSVTPVCLFGAPWSLLVLILNIHTVSLFQMPFETSDHLPPLLTASFGNLIYLLRVNGPVAHGYVEESFLPS